MARTKIDKESHTTTSAASIAPEGVDPIAEAPSEVSPEAFSASSDTPSRSATASSLPSYEELLAVVQNLAGEVQILRQNAVKMAASDASNASNTQTSQSTQYLNSALSSDGELASILAKLVNRKSEREVSIVHNNELSDGLSTHIELSNLTIDFSRLGETRLLSWQQFEEVVSKYRRFFDMGAILVAAENADVAEKYDLPYINNNKAHLTQEVLKGLVNLSAPELETFVNSLSAEEQDTIYSFWLGKCYTRTVGYYDRYKIETLNRISNGQFGNLILVMNGDGRNIPTDN